MLFTAVLQLWVKGLL